LVNFICIYSPSYKSFIFLRMICVEKAYEGFLTCLD
jgi:hypothetical protein